MRINDRRVESRRVGEIPVLGEVVWRCSVCGSGGGDIRWWYFFRLVRVGAVVGWMN